MVILGCQDNEETKSLLDLTQQDDKCVKQSIEPQPDYRNSTTSDSTTAEEHQGEVDKPAKNYFVEKFLNQSECINDKTSASLGKDTRPLLDQSKEISSEENPTDYSVSLNLVAVTSENEDVDHDADVVDDSNDDKSEKNEVTTKKTKTKPMKIMYCEECDTHFDKPVNLRKHQSSHVKESFKCIYCNKCFRHSWSLQSHIGTHTGERPFTCNICFKSFTDRSALSSHQRITHFTEKTHMCSYCGKAFKLKKQLERHERIHTGHEYHRCDICGKLFTQKCNLMKHLVLHSGQKPFSCSICQQSFAQKDNLNIHVLRHHSQQNPVVCDVCGKVFKNKMTLMGHKKTKHTENTKQIICEVCGKFFPDRSCLNSHKWVHSGGPINCDVCGKSYPHARAIRVHKRIVHTEVRKYCCDVCGIGFKTSQTLKHHKVVHTGERAFGCEECGRCFGQRTALKTHMRIHSGIEPYSCPRCNESFKWKQTCDKHVVKCVGKPCRDFVMAAEDSIS